MILLPMLLAATAPTTSSLLSSQTALAEAFVSSNWPVIETGLTEDVQVVVFNYHGKQQQKATGKAAAVTLISSFRPTLGNIALEGCEVRASKPDPEVLCYYTADDKTIRELITITTAKGDRASIFFVAMDKK